MQILEIFYNSADKQVKIDQDGTAKKYLSKSRLPFTIDVQTKEGARLALSVAVAREDNTTIVHLFDGDKAVGRLYLAKPDIFPGAFYVSSMALLPEYQGLRIGPALYNGLMEHLGISFVGVDQSPGAIKMWTRLSKMPGNSLFAVMPTRSQGNVFFDCLAEAKGYAYVNYDGTTKMIGDGSSLYVILTRTDGKMASYISQHMKLTKMRYELTKMRAHSDPFAAYAQPA